MATDNANLMDQDSGVEVLIPPVQTAPVIFASPHSGRSYPESFIAQSRLGELNLRRSEDAFIDEVFLCAPQFGAAFLRAHFPRAYIDANRRPWELDPYMFEDELPAFVTKKSPHITAGLGTIPKIVANGEPIYAKKLPFSEARRRMETHHQPYHLALSNLVSGTVSKFGGCLLVDCHSMPSTGNGLRDTLSDIVIGDLRGKSCAPDIVDLVIETFRNFGYSVGLNKPYAGGYTTRHYSKPESGVHTLQIEIRRALYMDEKKITRGPGLSKLIDHVQGLIKTLTAIDPGRLASPDRQLPRAAE